MSVNNNNNNNFRTGFGNAQFSPFNAMQMNFQNQYSMGMPNIFQNYFNQGFGGLSQGQRMNFSYMQNLYSMMGMFAQMNPGQSQNMFAMMNMMNMMNCMMQPPVQGAQALSRPQSITPQPSTPSVQPPVQPREEPVSQQQLERNVKAAQDAIKNGLNSLTDDDLRELGIDPAKRTRLLSYISNITYDDDTFGSARAEGNGIVISRSILRSGNVANMVKLLIHEANHCDKHCTKIEGQPRIDTKEEEAACEKLGLLTAAKLIENGTITGCDDFGCYPMAGTQTAVTKYLSDSDLLDSHIKSWLDAGYTNLPDNMSGDITVEHEGGQGEKFKIKSGDVVKIGDQEFTIGQNGTFLQGTGRTPILQLLDARQDPPIPLVREGNIVLDGMEPTGKEKNDVGKSNIVSTDQVVTIVRNGQVVYTGKIYK